VVKNGLKSKEQVGVNIAKKFKQLKDHEVLLFCFFFTAFVWLWGNQNNISTKTDLTIYYGTFAGMILIGFMFFFYNNRRTKN